MSRKFIAIIVASSLALTTLTAAPSYAGSRDRDKALLGAAAFVLLGAAIVDASKDKHRKARVEHRQPRVEYRHPRVEHRHPRYEHRQPRYEHRHPRYEHRHPRVSHRHPRAEYRHPRYDHRKHERVTRHDRRKDRR